MANQILTYAITKYTNEVEFLVQQMPARLWMASEIRAEEGSGAVAVEQVGATYASQVTGRAQPITITDTPADRRWVYPTKFFVADIVDTYEKLEIQIDPQGQIAKAQVFAMNRAKDDTWIANFFGTAQTGNTSTTSNAPTNTVAFPATQLMSVNAGSSGYVGSGVGGSGGIPTGMNVPKLRYARQLLLKNEVDLDNETPYVGMAAQQLDNMLNQAQAISLDFGEKPIMAEGKIVRFMGFDFIHSERFLLNGSTQRRNPCWVKSGMRGAVWKDVTIDIRQRSDLTAFPYQISVEMMVGATRLQETKCIEIPCTEP